MVGGRWHKQFLYHIRKSAGDFWCARLDGVVDAIAVVIGGAFRGDGGQGWGKCGLAPCAFLVGGKLV